jgi:hypothetical protein
MFYISNSQDYPEEAHPEEARRKARDKLMQMLHLLE